MTYSAARPEYEINITTFAADSFVLLIHSHRLNAGWPASIDWLACFDAVCKKLALPQPGGEKNYRLSIDEHKTL
jgi:hypothetical protein